MTVPEKPCTVSPAKHVWAAMILAIFLASIAIGVAASFSVHVWNCQR